MYRLVFAALLLLLVSSLRLEAQADSTGSKVLKGIIVDDSLGIELPFAHLWNERTRMGAISNESGEFIIRAESQDTLVFSALGYKRDSLVVADSTLHDIIMVRLKPKKYEIAEVVVRRWSSYAAFKHDFLTLELPGAEIEPLKAQIRMSANAAALEADYERAAKDKMNGFGYSTHIGEGINIEKERKARLDNLKKREQIIAEKFNRVLVADLTKLEGDALTEFIASCNFSDDYLYNTDLYTIIEALYAKFDVYQSLSDTLSSAQ